MIGQSRAFRVAEALIAKMAPFDAPVLIEGETGTGKELAARAIHRLSPRGAGPFLPINCGALPEHLVVNELFGHRRGAFTDAREDQPGLVSLARAGTLFLDEVDALSHTAQVALLRFLQDQTYLPLGARRPEQADVRIIAATNGVLEKHVAAGTFRPDLYYRLKLLQLTMPPLRARKGDIPLLATHFLADGATRFGRRPARLLPATLQWFEHYHWPGNVRELENMVHSSLLLKEGEWIEVDEPAGLLPRGSADAAMALNNYKLAKLRAIDSFETIFLTELFAQAQGNITEAARISGTERRHIGRLFKKYRIPKATAGS